MKPIRLERNQEIGRGATAIVYKISPRRVVKVFKRYRGKALDKIVEDEIENAKRFELGLPGQLVYVFTPRSNRGPVKAVMKRYLPRPVSWDDIDKIYEIEDPEDILWDIHSDNFRKDSKGKIYWVDTQSERVYAKYFEHWF